MDRLTENINGLGAGGSEKNVVDEKDGELQREGTEGQGLRKDHVLSAQCSAEHKRGIPAWIDLVLDLEDAEQILTPVLSYLGDVRLACTCARVCRR